METRPTMCDYLIDQGFSASQLWSFSDATITAMVKDLRETEEDEEQA